MKVVLFLLLTFTAFANEKVTDTNSNPTTYLMFGIGEPLIQSFGIRNEYIGFDFATGKNDGYKYKFGLLFSGYITATKDIAIMPILGLYTVDFALADNPVVYGLGLLFKPQKRINWGLRYTNFNNVSLQIGIRLD